MLLYHTYIFLINEIFIHEFAILFFFFCDNSQCVQNPNQCKYFIFHICIPNSIWNRKNGNKNKITVHPLSYSSKYSYPIKLLSTVLHGSTNIEKDTQYLKNLFWIWNCFLKWCCFLSNITIPTKFIYACIK